MGLRSEHRMNAGACRRWKGREAWAVVRECVGIEGGGESRPFDRASAFSRCAVGWEGEQVLQHAL